MDSGRERIIFIIFVGIGFLLAFFMQFVPPSLSEVGFVMGLIALLCATMAFAIKDYSYLIDPLLRMKGRSLVLDANDPFYLSANGKAIVIRAGNIVYATSFIKIPIYKSSTEMSEDEKFNFATVFSRAISISAKPMRLSSQLYLVNKEEYLEVITTRLNEVEDRYNAIMADKNATKTSLNRVKGEVNMWHNLLDSVTKSNSQSQVAYVTITSIGGSEDEAVNIASMEAEQVSAGLSASLGVPTSVANGDDMMLFIEPEYLIPLSAVADLNNNSKSAI